VVQSVKKSFKLLFVSLHFLISSFKRLSRLGIQIVTEIRQHMLNLRNDPPFFSITLPCKHCARIVINILPVYLDNYGKQLIDRRLFATAD
jgi:hypothetical protein